MNAFYKSAKQYNILRLKRIKNENNKTKKTRTLKNTIE